MPLNTSDTIAIVSLVVSSLSVFITIRFNSKQVVVNKAQQDLNKILIDKEKLDIELSKKADLGARIVKLGSNDYRLKIFNSGKSSAKNIQFILSEECSFLINSDVNSKFPLKELAPQSNVDLIAAFTLDSPSKFEITLAWVDEASSSNRKTLTVTW